MTQQGAWREVTGGVELAVRAKPRSSRSGVESVVTDTDGTSWLVVRVTVPAEDGKANSAIIAEVARSLQLSRSAVTLITGHTARRKRLMIEGDPAKILSGLKKAVS